MSELSDTYIVPVFIRGNYNYIVSAAVAVIWLKDSDRQEICMQIS